MDISHTHSGIVLEQNASVNGSLDLRDDPRFINQSVYQTFYLSDYIRGSNVAEQRAPSLSGLQVMVDIDSGYEFSATLDYTLEYFIPGSGWSTLIVGSQIGNHADGQCWMNLIFPTPLKMNATIAGSLLRIGLTAPSISKDVLEESVVTVASDTYLVEGKTVYAHLLEEKPFPITLNGRGGFLYNDQGTVTFSAQQGVNALYYTEDSLLAPAGQLFQEDGKTFAVDQSASLNFRVLALVADSGTSFLGNEYRSCVVLQDGSGTDTGNDVWISQPQPSPFAVVSRYFDLRPSSTSIPFTSINQVYDPSFEYDFLSGSPYMYQEADNLVTRNNFSVVNTWAYSGTQSLRSTATFSSQAGAYSGIETPGSGTQGVKITPGSYSYSAGAKLNVLSLPSSTSGIQISIDWYDTNNSIISTAQGPFLNSLGEGSLVLENAVVPSTTSYGTLKFICASDSSGVLDFEIDAVQLVQSSTLPEYGDGDTAGWGWSSARGKSPSGPFVTEIQDSSVVVDSVLVDPNTPNMAFNIYYSNDDTNNSDNMTEADWEGKLWTRVPTVFTCTQRQQYVFPEPVGAKYFKLEFCNLNPQTYHPGTFPQPVIYKKMPTWVADYFITQLELPTFTANLVNVQNDALTLAYDYYLDDLSQSPSDPTQDPPTKAQLTSYFQQNDAANYVDANTLSQINLIMNSYQVPTGSIVNSNTLLGSAAQTIANTGSGSVSLTSEVPNTLVPVISTVSTSNRDEVVFEQSLPVMYFFLTCRHGYKEVSARFNSNKAYFAGTNSIEFLRHNYDVVSDQDLYVESGLDSFNSFRNDFVLDQDENWFTYDVY